MAVAKKCAAGVSAVSLAVGMSVVGAGAASAQGSLGALGDLPGTIADLQLADQALNGPVSVEPNAEGGPTVSYTNETDIVQRCSGFTMPYTTVDENDIDPNALDGAGLSELSELAQTITADGGVAILNTVDGEQNSYESGPYDIVFTVNDLIAGEDSDTVNTGVPLQPGESVSWDAVLPEVPSAAAIMCVPDSTRGLDELSFSFGVDKQVVADQINDKLGPLGSVGAGSISGGSVELGATALAPLGEIDTSSLGSSDEGADEGADDGADDGGEQTPVE